MVGYEGTPLCCVVLSFLTLVWSLVMSSELNLNEVIAEYGPKTIGASDEELRAGKYPLPNGFRYRKPKGKPYLRNGDGSAVIVAKEKRVREGAEEISVPDGGFTSADVPGWNYDRHRLLKAADFKDEVSYWTWRKDSYAKSLVAECDRMIEELGKYTPEERKARASAKRETTKLENAAAKLATDDALLAGLSEETRKALLAKLMGM